MKRIIARFSITSKLLTLALFFWLVVSAAGVYWLHWQEKQLKEGFSRRATSTLKVALSDLDSASINQSPQLLHQNFAQIENDPDISFLYLRDMNGRRIYGYHDESFSYIINKFNAQNRQQAEINDYLLVKQKLIWGAQPHGYLIAGFNQNRIHKTTKKSSQFVFGTLGVLGLAVVLSTILLSRLISSPVRSAIQAIRQYADHDEFFYIRIPEEGKDEIARFAAAFNTLAGELDQKLQASNNYQRYVEAFFRLSPIPILITDSLGKVKKANQSACNFFEIDLQKLLKKNLEKLINRNDFYIIKNHINNAQVDILGYITVVITPNGNKRISELNISLLRDNSEELKGYIVTLIDVTDKIQTQQEILENQSKLADINRELYHKTKELESANEKNQKNARKLARLIEISYEIIRCDSSKEALKLLTFSGMDLLEAQDCVVYLWDSGKEYLKPAKTPGTKAQKSLKPVSENNGVIWRTFKDNQSYFLTHESLQSADFEELGIAVERVWVIAVPVSDEDYKYGVAVYLQRQEDVFHIEDLHLITTLAHQTAITLDKIYLMQALREKAQHLETVNEDLKKSQQQVIQLQKMESLGRLVGGIAHDFNNILGIITPNIDMLLLNSKGDKEVMKRATIIQEATERASTLTRQLLMFSRNQEVKLNVISPNELIKQLIAILRHTIGKHIELRTVLDETLPNINADETRITQVLMNLAVNARDAMPQEGGIISFRTALVDYSPSDDNEKHLGKYVRISVSDTGMGIAEEHLNKIFDPFFTTKNIGKGTGLGLSVVYGIVKSHEGYIEVETTKNRGTTFHIYFKPTEKSVKEEVKVKATDFEVGSERILVVDDEDLIRESLKVSLESLGYQVDLAASGEEAIKLVKNSEEQIDIAIIDLAMPQMNGIETMKALRGIDPNIQILLSTGYPDQEQLIDERLNIDGFLPKPYHVQELAQLLKDILNKKITSN